jgi:hypothetical protein
LDPAWHAAQAPYRPETWKLASTIDDLRTSVRNPDPSQCGRDARRPGSGVVAAAITDAHPVNSLASVVTSAALSTTLRCCNSKRSALPALST